MLILYFIVMFFVCGIIAIILEKLGFSEKAIHRVILMIHLCIIGFYIVYPVLRMTYQTVIEEINKPKSTYKGSDDSESYEDASPGGNYHYTSGYTRNDGTEVQGYISGNPDGIRENNIEYMRDHGDSEGLRDAYSSSR
jgi:uncharacterized membrane protein